MGGAWQFAAVCTLFEYEEYIFRHLYPYTNTGDYDVTSFFLFMSLVNGDENNEFV